MIEDEQRLWGIDYDALRGWHVHPLDRPDAHRETAPKTIEEVVQALEETWEHLP